MKTVPETSASFAENIKVIYCADDLKQGRYNQTGLLNPEARL